MRKTNQSSMTQKEFINFCQDKDKTYLATQLYQWKQKALINQRKLKKIDDGFSLLFFPELCKAHPELCNSYDETYTPYDVLEYFFFFFFCYWISEYEFHRIVRSWIGGVEDE